MSVLITDPDLESRLISERQRCDGDRFDEVWEGLYVMPPLPNDEHQDIQARFVSAIQDALGWDSPAKIRAGVNVSDRNEDWTHNYRGPDVVVFLPGNPAINRGAHWQGGPDFLIEIVSKGDRALEKLDFYAKVGVREAMIVQRDPWSLELYSLTGSPPTMRLSGVAKPDEQTTVVRSDVLPFVFQFQAAAVRPKIKMSLINADARDTEHQRNFWLI